MKRVTVFIPDESYKKTQLLQAHALPLCDRSVSFSHAIDFIIQEAKVNPMFKAKFVDFVNAKGGQTS